MDTSYVDMLINDMKRKLAAKSKPISEMVLHRRTCPVCGAKMVNLYFCSKSGEFVCKRCKDELEENNVN